jgi:hypothetical protein
MFPVLKVEIMIFLTQVPCYLINKICLQGSRARFRHLSLHNSSAKNTALESITSLSNQVYFGDDAEPSIPIVYTYTYVEWEANKVII